MAIGSGSLDIVLRTAAVYVIIVVGLLVLGKKELSQISVTDLVFIMLLSNAVQNAMVGDNTSLEGGVIAAMVLFVINFLFRQINFRSKSFRSIVQGDPVLLIYEGILLEKHLAKERITIEELMAALREHGVTDIKDVKLAMLEIDGNISVVSQEFVNQTRHRKHAKGLKRQ